MALTDPCPSCGGKSHQAHVRGTRATKKCTNCGYTASLHNTTPSHVIARPAVERPPLRKTHPHHFTSLMLALFALVVLILFFRVI